MQCCRPITAWRDLKSISPASGLHTILFKRPSDIFLGTSVANTRYQELLVPCGKCLPCRKARAFEISIRARCEASISPGCNYFITLTVDDSNIDNVFPNHKLSHVPWQLFAKRLRKRFPFRFLMTGEYGERTHRPHYHAILFGIPHNAFNDCYVDQQGCFHSSRLLEDCWPFGHANCVRSNDNTISYVAGYQLKKYSCEDEFKSYVKWSRRPGLGSLWIERFWQDVYKRDGKLFLDDGTVLDKVVSKIIFHNQEIPFSSRFFENKLSLLSPERYAKLKSFRENRSLAEPPLTADLIKAEIDKQHRHLNHLKYTVDKSVRDFS